MKKKEELYVTKSSLPPLEEFLPYLGNSSFNQYGRISRTI